MPDAFQIYVIKTNIPLYGTQGSNELRTFEHQLKRFQQLIFTQIMCHLQCIKTSLLHAGL